MTNLYDFTLPGLDGKRISLADFRGKVCLVVNTASKCGLTPQYEGLQKLHEEYGSKGVVVLGFPCNQFGKQEPGNAETIRSFCTDNYGVTFPMFAKVDVNGDNRHALFDWLTSQPTQPEGTGDVPWNFGKFIVGKDGAVAARFDPKVAPDEAEFIGALESAMSAGGDA